VPEVEQFLHVRDIPDFLYEQMGVRITVSTLHKKLMPSLGTGPKPAGRWGGRPIFRPADILQWAQNQISESREA
jgi:hypothetical protein